MLWLVRVAQRVRHLAGDLQRVVQRQLTLAPEPIPEGLALHVGHRVPELAGRFTGIEHRQDVRVLQAGGGPDFALEAFWAERGSQLGMKHLQGDRAVVLEVVGEVHRGHAAPAQLALEPVAVSQGRSGAARGGLPRGHLPRRTCVHQAYRCGRGGG